MIVPSKCPNCGANMDIDDSRDFCFCPFCGYKIINMVEKVEVSGMVQVDNSQAINNLLGRASQFEENGSIDMAYDYYNKVLDLDYSNAQALAGIRRLDMIITEPNVTIRFVSEISLTSVLRIQSGKMRTVIVNGGTLEFTFPIGTSKIIFKGRKTYKREIVINDRHSRVNILYTEGKHVNRIDMF